MTKHPEVDRNVGDFTKLLGGAAGGLLGGGLGLHTAGSAGAVGEGLLGTLVGHEYIPPVINVLKNATGRAVSTPLAQRWLKYQGAAPNRPDNSALIRLLLSPAETKLLPGQ